MTTAKLAARPYLRANCTQDELDKLRAINADLLAALQAITPMFDNDSALLAVYSSEIEQCRAAISSATGAGRDPSPIFDPAINPCAREQS